MLTTKEQREELLRAAHSLSDKTLDTKHREDELVAYVEALMEQACFDTH